MAIITAKTAVKPKCLPKISSARLIGLGININKVRFSISLLMVLVPIKMATITLSMVIEPIPKSNKIFSWVPAAISGISLVARISNSEKKPIK